MVVSHRRTHPAGITRLVAAGLIAMLAASCRGGSSIAYGRGTGHGAARTGTAKPVGPAIDVTTFQGYKFRESLDPPGLTEAPSVPTSDTGNVINTPPGRALIVATVAYTNPTSRDEPFVLYPRGIGQPMPYAPDSLYMVVPVADAAKFGISPGDSQLCKTRASPGGSSVLSGYCDLKPEVVAVSPGPGPSGQLPQLAPGKGATVTVAVIGYNAYGAPDGVPESAPLKDVKLYADSCPAATKTCPAQLN
jgi:hypothetical protein